MISARGFHGILAFKEFVWVFCGTEGKSTEVSRDSGSNVEYYLTRCEQYNVIHNTWGGIEQVPGPGRENPAVVPYKDANIFLCGGNNSVPNNRIEKYLLGLNEWETCTYTLETPTTGASGCFIGEDLCIMGGKARKFMRWDGSQWCKERVLPAAVEPHFGYTPMIHDNQMYIISIFGQIIAFDMNTGYWRNVIVI